MNELLYCAVAALAFAGVGVAAWSIRWTNHHAGKSEAASNAAAIRDTVVTKLRAIVDLAEQGGSLAVLYEESAPTGNLASFPADVLVIRGLADDLASCRSSIQQCIVECRYWDLRRSAVIAYPSSPNRITLSWCERLPDDVVQERRKTLAEKRAAAWHGDQEAEAYVAAIEKISRTAGRV